MFSKIFIGNPRKLKEGKDTFYDINSIDAGKVNNLKDLLIDLNATMYTMTLDMMGILLGELKASGTAYNLDVGLLELAPGIHCDVFTGTGEFGTIYFQKNENIV